MKAFDRAVSAVEAAVLKGICPSAAFAVGTKDKVLREAWFGVENLEEKPLKPVGPETLYDMASLTKILATSMVTFRFVEEGLLRLDDTMDTFFPGTLFDKREITIRQLLTHTSGIPEHFFLFEEASSPSRAAEAVLAHPLCCKPGEEVHYSCMGYILLGRILEKVGEKPLDVLAEELVFDPLGMKRTGFRPRGTAIALSNKHTGFRPKGTAIAATERDPDSGKWLKGTVHDENARFLGGVSGNAGIFSNLQDMERFAQMLTGGGVLEDKRFLSPAMLQAATRCYTSGLSENRGLGFKLAFGSGNFMGDLISPSAFGHTGFTGTSLVVDPKRGLYMLLLTNRVHPTRDNLGLIRFRGLLHNIILSEWSGEADRP